MTYCVGLLLQDGMVLLSDTRTNAGLDNISTYRKMFIFENQGERVIAIMTAGSLSITQTTIARLRDAIDNPEATGDTSILMAPTMLKVAEIVGNVLASVRSTVDEKLSAMNQGATASMIVAGQRKDGAMRMFLIYPEGNFIEATEDTPYFQIGESKYGKPIIDRVIRYDTTPLDEAAKCTLVSFDSTIQSNLSVGLPIDMIMLRANQFEQAMKPPNRIGRDDPYFQALRMGWSAGLRKVFDDLPNEPWFDA